MKWLLLFVGCVVILAGAVGGWYWYQLSDTPSGMPVPSPTSPPSPEGVPPLAITALRQKAYPGSPLVVEQSLPDHPNYRQMIVSYHSDGLKIFALLTVPLGVPPPGGFPALVFNHGYIAPEQYTTAGRYVAYVDGFAKNGFVVLKPDYRGHGQSEGHPGSAYYSADYVTDVLNAYVSLAHYPGVDPHRVGMWGHSMGGHLTLMALVLNPDIKAAVIWGGVVGTYDDLINHWQHRVRYHPAPEDLTLRNQNRQNLISQYGTPQTNPVFWDSIDPNSFLADVTAPVQLDVGGSDEEVPVDFSQGLAERLRAAGKKVQLNVYPGADHNLSGRSFSPAMTRSVDFFKANL